MIATQSSQKAQVESQHSQEKFFLEKRHSHLVFYAVSDGNLDRATQPVPFILHDYDALGYQAVRFFEKMLIFRPRPISGVFQKI